MAPSLEIGSGPHSLLSAKTANVSSPWVAGRRLPDLDGGWSLILEGVMSVVFIIEILLPQLSVSLLVLLYFLVRNILFNNTDTVLAVSISLSVVKFIFFKYCTVYDPRRMFL
jgi:hypothetical protein